MSLLTDRSMARLFAAGVLVLRGFRPEGAPGCSHGWSAAEPVGGVVFSHACPGGAEEASKCAAAQSNTYFSSNSIP